MTELRPTCDDGCGRLAAVRLSYTVAAGETVSAPEPKTCLDCSNTRERNGDRFRRHWLDDNGGGIEAVAAPVPPTAVIPPPPPAPSEPPSSEAGQ